jgi:hypothetical protein
MKRGRVLRSAGGVRRSRGRVFSDRRRARVGNGLGPQPRCGRASFAAIRPPDGTVRGEAQRNARSLDAFAHIAIDCLQITGNVAHMSGTVVHTSDPTVFLPNESVHLAVPDNGDGAAAPPDKISGIHADQPFRCDGSAPPALTRTVVRGNVQVG